MSSEPTLAVFIKFEKIGLLIEYLMHATLSTFPLLSIALTGHCS